MMEDVPVKIAEAYKPPPQIRQHSVQLNSNKFQPNYYHESPEFQYDFQLEKKVLATLPEWRRMRQLSKEARIERQEKRRLQRLRENEERQKKLLGEVKYPSAEELSNASYESNLDVEIINEVNGSNSSRANRDEITNNEKELSNFNNILQPTILNVAPAQNQKDDNIYSAINRNQQKQNENNPVNLRRNTSFNYKDFEEDTSSPFDNIELKTINDLDILAQVLHDTQKLSIEEFKEIKKIKQETSGLPESPKTETPSDSEKQDHLNEKDDTNSTLQLENVNFNHLNHFLHNDNEQGNENDNIPNGGDMDLSQKMQTNSYIYNNADLASNLAIPFINNSSNCFTYNSNAVYNMQKNDHYVISPNSNGFMNSDCYSPSSNSDSPQQQYYNYQFVQSGNPGLVCSPLDKIQQRLENCDTKSKSVPDILKELSQEVTNSANRRNRNYSQNIDSKNNLLEEDPVVRERPQSDIKEIQKIPNKLFRKICAMGFPLERVTRVASVVGEDDKKILEHLITLTDLLDLGFEEEKISEALLKFDNSKEKALEYLIS